MFEKNLLMKHTELFTRYCKLKMSATSVFQEMFRTRNKIVRDFLVQHSLVSMHWILQEEAALPRFVLSSNFCRAKELLTRHLLNVLLQSCWLWRNLLLQIISRIQPSVLDEHWAYKEFLKLGVFVTKLTTAKHDVKIINVCN